MNIDKKFSTIVNEVKQETLSSQEKEAMRLQLRQFMKANPVQTPWHAKFASFWGSQPAFKYAAVSLATLAIIFGTGVGFSFAAQSALPGEFLYPVKTGVNEQVLAWFTGSDQAKAQLYISFANTRLQEVETLAAKGQ